MLIKNCVRLLALSSVLVLLGWSCSSQGTEVNEPPLEAELNRPNILWIVGENLNLDLGIYGEELVATPNLDSLVRRGTTFTRAYNQGSWSGAVCVASRTMLVTGLLRPIGLWIAAGRAELEPTNDTTGHATCSMRHRFSLRFSRGLEP